MRLLLGKSLSACEFQHDKVQCVLLALRLCVSFCNLWIITFKPTNRYYYLELKGITEVALKSDRQAAQ